jgi:arylformamidase
MSFASENNLDCEWSFHEVYDITALLNRAPDYPGDRKFLQDWMAGFDDSDGYSLSALSLSSHAGTHLDFPSHVKKGGKSQDSYSPDRFIMPAEVISVPEEGPVQPSSLKDSMLSDCRTKHNEALLIRTPNSQKRLMNQPGFSREYASLSLEAASICVSGGIALVGIDYISVDRFEDNALPVHHMLLDNGVIILEGIDLSAVPSGRYLLICLPLKIDYAEASPVRAVLVR